MTTWTTIPDSNLDVDKPVRSIDALALRDNPAAIAEGAAGAPRVKDAALSTSVTTAGTDWVRNRTAAAVSNTVGTYCFASPSTTGKNYAPGTILAGSSLKPHNAKGSAYFASLSGTWRCMGFVPTQSSPNQYRTLWLRIA